jgi:hypothetical protein
MELMIQLVYAHAELSKASSHLLRFIISKLLESILQSYFGFIESITGYSHYSWLQLKAELAFVVLILAKVSRGKD